MVPRYAMSLHFVFFSFTLTCMIVMSARALPTKVPLRPYLRGNPGLLPQTVSSHKDISVAKGVEDCQGQAGCLLKDGALPPESVNIAPLSDLVSPDRRFPFDALNDQKTEACPENVDGSDPENDDEDDDGDAEDKDDDDDDDANDEDFSGEEGGDDDDDCEGDPEEDPTANGDEGSDDDDNDNDDDDDDDGGEVGDDDDEEEEEEGEDEEEDEDQPPAKKRK